MAKLSATATKTVQLEFANLLDFRGFLRVLLVRVRPEIALITRGSVNDSQFFLRGRRHSQPGTWNARAMKASEESNALGEHSSVVSIPITLKALFRIVLFL